MSCLNHVAGPSREGLGSTHTPANYVWPLSWMVEAVSTANAARRAQLLRWALGAQCGNGLMHESIDVTDEVRLLMLMPFAAGTPGLRFQSLSEWQPHCAMQYPVTRL